MFGIIMFSASKHNFFWAVKLYLLSSSSSPPSLSTLSIRPFEISTLSSWMTSFPSSSTIIVVFAILLLLLALLFLLLFLFKDALSRVSFLFKLVLGNSSCFGDSGNGNVTSFASRGLIVTVKVGIM